MTVKKKIIAKSKNSNQKKSKKSKIVAKKTANKKSPKVNDILLTASEIDSEINDNEVTDPSEIIISEENYVLVTDYSCSMSAYQDPDDSDWRFALEIFTDSGKLIDIHSQKAYETYQDALFDCYGIIEYLGFGVIDPSNSANITVNHWNSSEEKYDEETVLFDGSDFFKIKK